jgi:hypothetical protein
MNKVSRNDPCPCGSGKKYKKCCIGKVLQFPIPNSFEEKQSYSSNDFMEKVKKHFAENKFNSLEEMNEELGTISKNFNSQGQDDFLGLSPTQMHKVLNSPLSLDNEIFKIELESEKELDQVPIFNQALYFLRKIQEAGDLKATQKGNLPKLFVVDLYEKFFFKDKYTIRPNREDDLPQMTRLKLLLEISGLIKKRNNKFSLTKKGAIIFEENKKIELFELIFINFANTFNWAFLDGHSELNLIQRSATFNFLLLNKKCRDWTLDRDLGQFYLRAFPAITSEVADSSYSTPEKQVISCFSLRFLNRFCLPLGIVDYKEEKVKNGEYFDFFEYYKPTSFFQKNFKF